MQQGHHGKEKNEDDRGRQRRIIAIELEIRAAVAASGHCAGHLLLTQRKGEIGQELMRGAWKEGECNWETQQNDERIRRTI
jgi:predicted phage gp36 major capsid-like protein